IHDLVYFEMFATFFAFTSPTSAPPPHSWKTSGGLFDASAIGIFVCCKTFVSNGTALIVTSGWAAWYSSATSFQSSSPAPWLALCHQTSVTDLVLCFALVAAS